MAGMTKDQVNEVLLVGGSTHLRVIRDQGFHNIRTYFPEEVKISQDRNPDQVVAKGAAVLAGILSGKVTNLAISMDSTNYKNHIYRSKKAEINESNAK